MTRARDLAAFVSNADGDIKFDTDTLFIDSSANRVGIGETAPATNLHISSTANPAISIEDTDNGFAATTIQVENGGRDLDITVPQDTIFTQGSTEAMRILSNGKVGINVSPDRRLHVAGTGSDQGELHLTNDTTGHTQTDGSTFTTSSSDLLIIQRENANIKFLLNGSERMRMLPAGGLTFNGDTAAANALDDYEEGTWTPSFYAGFSGTPSFTYQTGYYVKIGSIVYTDFYLYFNATGNSAQIQVTGLPFNQTSDVGGLARGGGTSSYNNITSNIHQFYGAANTPRFSVYENGNSGVSVSTSVTNRFLIGTFIYKTDS